MCMYTCVDGFPGFRSQECAGKRPPVSSKATGMPAVLSQGTLGSAAAVAGVTAGLVDEELLLAKSKVPCRP